MKAKRKRIKSKGVMVAWSDGDRIHLQSDYLKKLDAEYYRRLSNLHDEMYRTQCFDADMLRRESRIMEDYSDKLWELDKHVLSLQALMEAAVALIDFEHVFISGYDTNYHHRNLVAFRRLTRRCKQRCQQDPQLWPLYKCSTAHEWYLEMEAKYADCKELGWKA